MDDFNTFNFKASMDALAEEAKKFNESLNKYSQQIKDLEQYLQTTFGVNFTLKASEDISIVWKRCDISKKFRIFVFHIDHGSLPLLESPLEVRIECKKYLNKFVQEITKYVGDFLSTME